MYKITIFLIGLFITALSYGQKNKENTKIDFVDLNKTTVLDFVRTLPIRTEPKPKTIYIITIGIEAKVGWIKDTDIDSLIVLIDSKEPAYCLMKMISSHLPVNESSTVGGHVMNILDAYRYQKEYPYILTDCPKNDEQRKTDILNWYEEFKNKH
jgi:hypothetical protein